ncbi:hypothetical protein CAS74_004803 [Pichia kudriavzevii]|uniref:Carboxymuconolactone decarboxylase-like domain-containing protein n=1 Tax=Pichia kudriavzevii TaxID=4909 RepID=A0A1Z8JHK3_PICKU|nr:hypothetical protein CAS74_004803 [Pichia kudriavzevii]
MCILTAANLQKLATWNHLSESWYLVASVALTVCNQPQEIPKLYHYAMHTKYMNELPDPVLYNKVLTIVNKFETIKVTGDDKNFNPYATENTAEHSQMYRTTDKMRESILKTAALSGLPRCINSMMILKETTPLPLRSNVDRINRARIKNWDDYVKVQQRGREYWENVYTKISTRVQGQMRTSYPDLWEYTIENVYSPLLSFNEVLTSEETSLAVVASLVPQNVEPQLKGHVKGALNAGIAAEKVDAAQKMAAQIKEWCHVQ